MNQGQHAESITRWLDVLRSAPPDQIGDAVANLASLGPGIIKSLLERDDAWSPRRLQQRVFEVLKRLGPSAVSVLAEAMLEGERGRSCT
jgi:hypothetical protein